MTASTTKLQLLLPGLLGPLADLTSATIATRFPAVEKLLVRADVESVLGWDYPSTLFHLFGYPLTTNQDLPEGAVNLLAGGGEPEGYCWMRADPVHLKADRDRLLLFNGEHLQIDSAEAEAIAQEFNQHFAQDGLQLLAPRPEHWLLRVERCPEMTTRSLHAVSGRHIEQFIPVGADAGRWRQLTNEMQMLLFQLPLNQQREAQGRSSINGIWISGIGKLPGPVSSGISRVVAGDATARGLAALNQIEIIPLPDQGVMMPERGEHLLMVDVDLLPAVANADPHAWSEAMHRLDANIQAMINSCKHDASGCLQIYPCNGKVYSLSASTWRRFWRRRRLVSDFFDKNEGEKLR